MRTFNCLLLLGGVMIGLWLIMPAALAQQRYPLTVQPTPADSRVRILNINPRYRPGIRLPPGAYHLEISHAGYQTIQQWVRLENQPLTVEVTLPPLASQAPVVEPTPPPVESQPPPAATPAQPAQPEQPLVANAARTETTAPQEEKPHVIDPTLAAVLQSGDLRHWRAVFATPPPNAEWLTTLRTSPIYWLLSPMTWFWLLIIWAVLAYWNRGWRLSAFGRFGLLSLILALPIGWLFYLDLWIGFIALLMGLVIIWWAVPSLPRLSNIALLCGLWNF